LAGVAGDLLTAGRPVLCVVADPARRRAGLEATIAGLAPGGTLAVASWITLGAEPTLAADFTHLLAVDPPPVAQGRDLLASAPGEGCAHLAWGPAETEFTRGYWRFQLEIRPELALLWRALSAQGGLDGADLERALRGAGPHPREGALAGRLLRVLTEIGLIDVDVEAREAVVLSTERRSLEDSPAFRCYQERLRAMERELAPAAPPVAALAG
jgi:single-stranded-DNA-specific exonuclease